MAPVALQNLIRELRAFIANGRMLQKDVASALDMSPSGLADALSGRNQFTGGRVISAQNLLQQKVKTIRTEAPAPPHESISDPTMPKNLGDAKEEIIKLRAQLAKGASAPALPSPAPITATVQKVVVAQSPAPVAAHVPIVTRPVAPTAKAPMNPLALLSLEDVIAGYKNACRAGNKTLALAYEAEAAKRTTKPRPPAPQSLLPDNPKTVREFLDSKSVPELKSLLAKAVLTSDTGKIYGELKSRGE
jgi:hypothetical protein